MMTKDEYLAFRREFEPKTVKLVVVAESPPKTGLYFYNPDGEIRAAVQRDDEAARLRAEDQGGGAQRVSATRLGSGGRDLRTVDGTKNIRKRNAVIEQGLPSARRRPRSQMLPDKLGPRSSW